MTRLLSLIIIAIQLYDLRITAYAQEECLACVKDDDTLNRITMAHLTTLAEIDRLAAEKRRLQRGKGLRAWSAA